MLLALQGTSAGVGFAIPIDAVARAVPQLIQFGKLIRPSLRIEVSFYFESITTAEELVDTMICGR